MENLIKEYKESGSFTHQQMIDHFRKPKTEVLDMIINSDDYNFRKTCLNAIFDYNLPDTIVKEYKDFINTPIIKKTLKKSLVDNEKMRGR